MLTDLEFYELRYAGRAASFVRGFRAIYLGLFFNCWIIATVNLALVKIAGVLFGWPRAETLAICVVVPIIFAATAGLWGVMVTDMIQFCITMTSAFAAAYFAIHAPGVGGLHGLVAHFARATPRMLAILPNFGDWQTALGIFVIPITVLWWSVWYPGAEPGGGSYVAQRMLAARTESDALFGTFAFQVMHYALRPWPWIVVALASTIVYPTLHDIQLRFPDVAPSLIGNDIAYPAMLVFLPAGFAGFMVAGIFAAYRSTIETHLNWGTSYLVHDFYQRFIRPGSSAARAGLGGAARHGAADGARRALHARARQRARTRSTLLALDRRGNRTDLSAALVLVAHQRLERGERDARSFVVSLGVLRRRQARARRRMRSIVLLTTIGVTTVVWLAVTFLTPPVETRRSGGLLREGPAGRPRLGASPPRARAAGLARFDAARACRLGAGAGGGLRRALRDRGLRLRAHRRRASLWSAIAAAAVAGLFAIGRHLWRPRGRPGARRRLSSTGSNELENSQGAVQSAGHRRDLRDLDLGGRVRCRRRFISVSICKAERGSCFSFHRLPRCRRSPLKSRRRRARSSTAASTVWASPNPRSATSAPIEFWSSLPTVKNPDQAEQAAQAGRGAGI